MPVGDRGAYPGEELSKLGTGTVRIVAGHKRFDADSQALSDIDLTIEDGEFLAILGRSGSGKSTLLRVIAGLEKLTSGTIEWAEWAGDNGAARPHTGVVFQQALLYPWLTAGDNVLLAGRFAAQRESFRREYAEELLQRFDLQRVADRYPDQLSGGQAQRVAIIRAVATRPRLLLLDEPFSALDPAIRADLQAWLANLAAELGITVVLVTHDVDEALLLASRVVLLGPDGRIRREWRPGNQELRQEILDHYRLVEQ
ncbi:ATP-binding cassette domain-containing protein [Mycobacterium bourgelatii]|uniref:Nitrate ABC transporter ATP-binding protein n=1 Tax=Mycobacterium bourgelatii TaxID=1273442 RepID=A0A7I9YTE8_MYCBU|nr:ATP-binding cassette domain-containing protein [Mycobacterium bourgelatii]GFG91905.1 nitrate ABC transporter ATP-binding protein [Mycobacterium bourgelatii]